MRLGRDPRYGAAVPGDHLGLSALHVVVELGKVSFGLRGLNFAHDGIP